jgi:hypothetical protein
MSEDSKQAQSKICQNILQTLMQDSGVRGFSDSGIVKREARSGIEREAFAPCFLLPVLALDSFNC